MAIKDTDDRPVVEQLPTGEETVNKDISTHRRKIIKASAAAIPAIMTLRSGAAAAMASTYHCTARDMKAATNEVTAPANVLDANNDHWLRVIGKKVTKNAPGGTEQVIYCTETGLGDKLDAWQCFDEDGNELTTKNVKPNLNQIINDGDDVALLVYLHFNEFGDDTGEPALYYPIIQTVQEAPSGYSPLTGSCLASIHPNLNLLGPNTLG